MPEAKNEEMVKLKLVGGERYSCPLLGDDIVTKGKVVEVSRKDADFLLEDQWTDALNNVHTYFKEVTEDDDSAKPARVARGTKKPDGE